MDRLLNSFLLLFVSVSLLSFSCEQTDPESVIETENLQLPDSMQLVTYSAAFPGQGSITIIPVHFQGRKWVPCPSGGGLNIASTEDYNSWELGDTISYGLACLLPEYSGAIS